LKRREGKRMKGSASDRNGRGKEGKDLPQMEMEWEGRGENGRICLR